MKRRAFIKNSLATAAVLGFPSILSARSPNEALCHACIGVGGMGGADRSAFKVAPGARIVALCDVDRNRLAEAAKAHPGARVYQNWRELLAAEGDRIDSVNVSTPDHTHTIIAANAMRLGKHVYCQKPLCKRLDECRLLRRIAAEKKVVTQLGTQFAATKSDRQIVALLQSGTIGPVTRVCLYSTRSGLSRKKRFLQAEQPVPAHLDWETWVGPAPMRPYAPGYHPTLWRVWRDFGSGWIGDLCIHVISAPWIGMGLDKTAPLSVRADDEPAFYVDPIYRQCWPRYSHIRWQFPGVAASGGKPFVMDWYSGVREDPTTPADFLPPKAYDALFAQTPLKTRADEGRVIEGEKGWILAPHAGAAPVALLRNGTVVPAPDPGNAPNHHAEFVAKCREGGTPRSSFAWSTYMMESVVMGGVAEQLPGKTYAWSAAESRFDDPAATALLKSRYRDGWTLEGL